MRRKSIALLVAAALVLSGYAFLVRGGQHGSGAVGGISESESAPSELSAAPPTAPVARSETAGSEPVPVRESEAALQVGTLDSDPVLVGGIAFGYAWTAKQEESVQEAVTLINPQTSGIGALMIPLLPGAADVRVGRVDGPKAEVEGGFAVVPVERGRRWQTATLFYIVPNHFAAGEAYEFAPPAFLRDGVLVGLASEYGDELVVVGDGFKRDRSLDARFEGYHVWASQPDLPKGTRLTWTIRPADPAGYKHRAPLPAPPKSCVSPDGKPLCGKGGK